MSSISKKTLSFCAAAAFGAAALFSQPMDAQAVETRIFAGAFPVNVTVMSLKEKKFDSVIKQNYDFSCGSAALATLLTYHYDTPVTEGALFDQMWASGDKDKIRREGFSLLDMKRYLQGIGMRSDGFRVPLEKLRQVGVPTITLITTRGYTHFVVLRGITDTHVVVGDPALGSRMVTREQFEKEWSGIAFAIHNKARLARSQFNLKRDLPFESKAYLGMAIDRSGLEAVTVLAPSANQF